VRRGTQRAALNQFAANRESRDQIEHECRRAARKGEHAGAQFSAEIAFDDIRIVFEPRIDLAAVASRGAPAGLLGLEQHDAHAAFGQMQRRREARESAADDHDVRVRRRPRAAAWVRRAPRSADTNLSSIEGASG
jgi:hypothetical protein